MDFYAVLDQVLELLRRRGRVSYRALKLQKIDQREAHDLKTGSNIAEEHIGLDSQ